MHCRSFRSPEEPMASFPPLSLIPDHRFRGRECRAREYQSFGGESQTHLRILQHLLRLFPQAAPPQFSGDFRELSHFFLDIAKA